MNDIRDPLFESRNPDSEGGPQSEFVIGTRLKDWKIHLIGFRICFLAPARRRDDAEIVALMFHGARITIVCQSSASVDSVEELLAGYEAFPYRFKPSEVALLRKQLEVARVECEKFADRRAPSRR